MKSSNDLKSSHGNEDGLKEEEGPPASNVTNHPGPSSQFSEGEVKTKMSDSSLGDVLDDVL